MSFKSIIKNENNIKLQYYGTEVFKRYSQVIRHNYFEPTDKIEMIWTTPLAKYNEVFIAKFDREEDGVRVYNVTDNYLN